MDSFHGTAISMIQFPMLDKPGIDRDSISINTDVANKKPGPLLPTEYSEVTPVALPRADLFSPVSVGQMKADSSVMPQSRETEDGWLSVMSEAVLKKEQLNPKDFASWAAYHANRHSAEVRPQSHIALMPLLVEPAHTAATIVHAMTIVTKATQHLHPCQTPGITMDQPLFCIAKEIQWAWLDIFGEDKFVVVMGGLHTEMNVMKLLGDILSGSGWTAILVQSEVTTSVRADAVLKGSHVTRS